MKTTDALDRLCIRLYIDGLIIDPWAPFIDTHKGFKYLRDLDFNAAHVYLSLRNRADDVRDGAVTGDEYYSADEYDRAAAHVFTSIAGKGRRLPSDLLAEAVTG